MTALFWTTVILGAALAAAVIIRDLRDWEPPSKTVHTLDCLDWRRIGASDVTCPAHHGADWFSTAQDRVHLSNELDGQLWIQETK